MTAMTTARAVILSAILLALAVMGSAWWVATSQAAASRYELANVGDGETHRLDHKTGAVLSCHDGQCTDITKGQRRNDKWAPAPAESDWPGKRVDAEKAGGQ